MLKSLTSIAVAALLLGGCAGTAREPIPEFAQGQAVADFTYVGQSLLRGVNGSSNTTPRGRPAAILDVTYAMRCLSGTSPSAATRFEQSKTLLDAEFKIAPLFFSNPRERSRWTGDASRLVVPVGCRVSSVRYETQSSDPATVLRWSLLNGAFTQ